MNLKFLKQLFLYGVFGVLTTVLNIFLYWFCTRVLSFSVVPATIIAWFLALLFAYYTNKKFVFESKVATVNAIFQEAAKFFLCRLATGVLDVIIMYIFADLVGLNDVFIKTVSNIIVIILNYAGSKIFVFKNKKEKIS